MEHEADGRSDGDLKRLFKGYTHIFSALNPHLVRNTDPGVEGRTQQTFD